MSASSIVEGDFNLAVFSDITITQQPGINNDVTRRQIPIATIDWQTSLTSHMLPINGLDFLLEADRLLIQQSVELIDVMSNLESENRYIVKVPRGETIYYAVESSNSLERTFFGSNRSFELKLYDPTQQEAIIMRRKLACGSCCTFCCMLQQLEVIVPPHQLLGTVTQQWHLSTPIFYVYNASENLEFRIEGVRSPGCLFSGDINFQIFNGEGTVQIGTIVHQWDPVEVAYNLYLQLPGGAYDVKKKALLLGAAFLMEYMYYETSKKRTRCKCIC